MFSLVRLTESLHWEESETAKSLLTSLAGDRQYRLSSLTGADDYLVVTLNSSNKEKSRVVILSRSHPDRSLEEATLLLPTSSPVLSVSTHLNTGILVQEDGKLSPFNVRDGKPHINSCISILSSPDYVLTGLDVSPDSSVIVWSESIQDAQTCNIHAIREAGGISEMIITRFPQVHIVISGAVVAFLPKSSSYSDIVLLYSITKKRFKIFEFSNTELTNIQPWKKDFSFKYFLINYTNKKERVKLVTATTGFGTNSFYILDGDFVIWSLSVNERHFLNKERVCSLNYPQVISDESISIQPQMVAYQQVFIILHGNHLRIFEPTQGVCVQSEEQLEGPISLHSYHFNNYNKLFISNESNIYLLENLPLKDQLSHIHSSVPEESRLSRLIRTPSLIQPWDAPSFQIKFILEAAHCVVKQKPDCIEDTQRAELESLFSQLNHTHIENPTIILNIFSKFPNFQTALHEELQHYQNSLGDMGYQGNNFTPYYNREDFSKKISSFVSLSSQQNDIFTTPCTGDVVAAYAGSNVKQEVFNYINSVVTESSSSRAASGYSYIFEYLCLVNPEEVLGAVKVYFSQDYKTNLDRKINWKKLFHPSEPLHSNMKDNEVLSSLFETICRLVFQLDPEYLIPFITHCQHLLDADYSKEPAFVRKSSHTQMYQRALEYLPNMSYLLSCQQELTNQRAVTYYKVLMNSKTVNSGYKCILILAAVSEWRAALDVLQQYTQNDYLHYYLFTTLSYLMNQAGVLTDYSQELHRMKTTKFSVGEHLQMFNQLSKFHSSTKLSSEMECNVAPFLKILMWKNDSPVQPN